MEPRGDALLDIGGLHGHRGGQGVRFRTVCGGQQEHAVAGVTQPAPLHQVAAPGQRGDGEPVAQSLAERGEVGDDAVQTLGARLGPAETGDHLVEDQYAAVPVGQLAQAGQVAGRRLGVGGGFEDQAGDLALVPGEQFLRGGQVPVGERHGELGGRRRYTGGHRRGADEPVVDGEERMVGAEGHPRAPGGGAGEAHRGGGGVGPVLGELHHLGGRHGGQEAFRGLDLHDGRPDEVAAAVEFPPHRLEHAWVGVAEADRPQAGPVLDVAVAVDVPHVGTAAVADDRGQVLGVLVVALGVGVRAPGDHGVQPLVRQP